jgi:hypothetical protein
MRAGIIGQTWPDAFAAHIIAGLSAIDSRVQRRIARSALENDCAVVITVGGVHTCEKRLTVLLEKLS